MAQDIVTVLKVETGNSEKTIKALKEEIKNLKTTLESAEIGSNSFEKASKDLAAAQAELKSVMDSTKQTVKSADGSYDALVATMAQLKKEWRATADEAKRSEIGKQIDAINTELKELDATLGNHQRNVGNYKGDIIEAFDEMGGGIKSYGERWGEMQKSTEQTRAKFESVQKMASGLASGFAAVQGAAALLGVENENLQKTFLKVQAAMAIAQGIGGLKDLIEGFTQAKTAFMGATMGLEAMSAESTVATTAMNGTAVATNTATVATNKFKKALIATGIGAFVVLLGTLIANWEKISKLWNDTNPQKEAAKEIKELRLEVEKLAIQSSAKQILRIKELSKAYIKLGDDLASKKKFVKDYAEELEDMGIEMNDVNDAEKIFREKTKDYCDAVMARAKADAARQAATTLYAEKMQKIAELNSEITTAEGDLYEYGETNQTFLQKVDAFFSRRYGKTMPESYQEDAKALIEGMKNEVKQLQTEADNAMSELFAFADAQDAFANGILGGPSSNSGSGGSSGGSSTDDAAAEAQAIAERAKQALIDTKEEELAELRRIYKEELALLKKHNIATGDLTKEYLDKQTELLRETIEVEGTEQEQLTALENFYNERIRIYTEAGVSTVELTAQFEAEKNAIIENFETQRQAALQQIANDGKTQKDLELQELTEEYNTYLELFKDHKEKLLLVEQWYKNQLKAIDDKYEENEEETAEEKIKREKMIANAKLDIASSVLGSLSSIVGEQTKVGKAAAVAQATIDTYAAANAAYSSMAGIPVVGPGLGAAAAAAAVLAGIANVKNILSTSTDGTNASSVISGGNPSVTPNVSMDSLIPINYTREILTDTETTELNHSNRVYVVESDITDTQHNVSVKENNASF